MFSWNHRAHLYHNTRTDKRQSYDCEIDHRLGLVEGYEIDPSNTTNDSIADEVIWSLIPLCSASLLNFYSPLFALSKNKTRRLHEIKTPLSSPLSHACLRKLICMPLFTVQCSIQFLFFWHPTIHGYNNKNIHGLVEKLNMCHCHPVPVS